MSDDPTRPGGGPDAATVDASPGSGSTAVLPTAAGDRFGRFRVEGMLGAGGMGVVFAAHDPLPVRRVAIKVMAQSADDTDGVAAEAQLLLPENPSFNEEQKDSIHRIIDSSIRLNTMIGKILDVDAIESIRINLQL